jgi:hypothetical protein
MKPKSDFIIIQLSQQRPPPCALDGISPIFDNCHKWDYNFIKTIIGESDMAEIKILKTDSRGRIILPPPFRKEPLFEYAVKGDQIILYPVRTVRKYPDMSDLPEEELSPDWVEREKKVNMDTRTGIIASTPSRALKKTKK